jgi:hypothetical protein
MISKNTKVIQEVGNELIDINNELEFKRGQLKLLELELQYLRKEVNDLKRIYQLGAVLNRVFTVKNLTRILLIIIIFWILL